MTNKAKAAAPRLDYARATRRALDLWTRDGGSWAETADGRPTKIHAADAATFNRCGACILAIEEQIGAGKSTSRTIDTLERRVCGAILTRPAEREARS